MWLHVCTHFSCTKQEKLLIYDHLQDLTSKAWLYNDFFWLQICECENEISPHYRSIDIGISSQLKSKVPTILRTLGLASFLACWIYLFFLDSFDVVIDFYYVSQVCILANLQFIFSIPSGPLSIDSLCDLVKEV